MKVTEGIAEIWLKSVLVGPLFTYRGRIAQGYATQLGFGVELCRSRGTAKPAMDDDDDDDDDDDAGKADAIDVFSSLKLGWCAVNSNWRMEKTATAQS